ncbi:MAG: hypothetical protein JWM86_1723, partial [Thermoleophilia bacterium]|nr:hypothetical protein [Thermoleophilia bacterium]
VSGAAPASLPQGRTTTVRISGVGFQSGATVTFSAAGVAVTSTTWVDSTSIDVVVDVAGNAALGTRDVTVQHPDLVSATGLSAFTVTAPSLTVSLSTLGFADGVRDTTAPWAIGFGAAPGGATRDIGPGGSGQTLPGAAALLQVVSDTDTRVDVAATAWAGPSALPLSTSLLWKHFGVSEAWTGFSTTASAAESTVAPGTSTFAYDLRLAIPTNQLAGSYSTAITWTVLAQP